MLLPLAFMANAAACPVCNTDTGKTVRAKIFDQDFIQNSAAVLAPIPVLVLFAIGASRWLGKGQ